MKWDEFVRLNKGDKCVLTLEEAPNFNNLGAIPGRIVTVDHVKGNNAKISESNLLIYFKHLEALKTIIQ
jgi:hypothetical protein